MSGRNNISTNKKVNGKMKIKLDEVHQVQLVVKEEVSDFKVSNKMKALFRKVCMDAFEKGRNFQRDGYIEVEVKS